jgi:hypothetical protein
MLISFSIEVCLVVLKDFLIGECFRQEQVSQVNVAAIQ